MKLVFIAPVFATLMTIGLFSAPAFAECAADLAKVKSEVKAANLHETAKVSAKSLELKATDALAQKNEGACSAAVDEIKKLIPAK